MARTRKRGLRWLLREATPRSLTQRITLLAVADVGVCLFCAGWFGLDSSYSGLSFAANFLGSIALLTFPPLKRAFRELGSTPPHALDERERDSRTHALARTLSPTVAIAVVGGVTIGVLLDQGPLSAEVGGRLLVAFSWFVLLAHQLIGLHFLALDEWRRGRANRPPDGHRPLRAID